MTFQGHHGPKVIDVLARWYMVSY